MATVPKKLLRTLPTLTEVVSVPADTLSDLPYAEVADNEALIQRVQARLELSLELRIQQAIEQVVREHLVAMEPAIRKQVDAEVRDAVTQALMQERLGKRAAS